MIQKKRGVIAMTEKRKLPIGIQNFEKLRKAGCVYIDKTDFVYKIVHEEMQF